jgi:hypothetical protein
MAPRSSLQQILELICEHVYFQAPTNVQMQYPAIVYEKAPTNTIFADNRPYSHTNQYSLMVISRDPDEPISVMMRELPMCSHDRSYVADNLNHDVFTLYF